MNRLTIIYSQTESYTLIPELKDAIADLDIDITLVDTNAFISQRKKSQGIYLFLFDRTNLGDPHWCETVSDHIQQSTQQINLCLIFGTLTLTEEMEFFSAFNDFLVWPCSTQEICTRLLKFLQPHNKNLIQENKLLQEFSQLHLTGASPVFVKTISLIKKIAGCNASVLIQGETGTGKENAARAIHYLSDRRNHAFVPINCAAIPDELIESELFGHEKGAFTDAKTTQAGLISLAQNGTLFLDEVDSLTPKAQAALLRFLQTQEYRPLGSKTTLQADVRILAATNADLKWLVEHKRFREDLYFRLNVLNLQMPPLRQRRQDIPLIAEALIEKFAQHHRTSPKSIHPQTLNYLMQQQWPGNIRELENILLRHFLLSSGSSLLIEQDQTSEDDESTAFINTQAPQKILQLSFQDAKARAINHFEENYLKELMVLARGNVSAAARMAGKERRALGKLLQKYHIQKTNLTLNQNAC